MAFANRGLGWNVSCRILLWSSSFYAAQAVLKTNNVTKTSYRQNENSFFLKGLVHCGSCRSVMTTSFSYSKGRKYHYYRCTSNNDRSKEKCIIASVQARQLEKLVIDELKLLAEDPRIIESVVEKATKHQRVRAKELVAKKKPLQDRIGQIERKSKNLLDVLGEEGKKKNTASIIIKELDELDIQATQLKQEIEAIEFEANDLENKIVSTELIVDNFKVFRDVYDRLTSEEKYDLLHLLIKKIVYYEDTEPGKDGKKRGKIKMDLWELPPHKSI